MSSARFRILRAALLLPLPLLVLLAVARAPFRPSAPPLPLAAPSPEPLRATPEHDAAFAFLENDAPAPASGPGLFATDFFTPPPPPPAPPPPPPPAPPPRPALPATYRGFASFPGGAAAIAYLAVGERAFTLSVGDAVAEGWRLLAFDADAAELARGEERLRLPFQRAVPLPVPASP